MPASWPWNRLIAFAFGGSGGLATLHLNKRRADKARRLFLAFGVARGWQGNNLR